MLNDIRNFLKYSKAALEFKTNIPSSHSKVNNIVVCGMGGSAIAGDVIRDAFKDKLKVPLDVSRSYVLPSFANKDTLVIFTSYSGNTRETLSQLNQAIKRKCKIVCISSNGKVKDIATKNRFPYVEVPSGMLPRAAFPYLLFASLAILQNLRFLSVPKLNIVEKKLIKIEKESKGLAKKLKNTSLIIISEYPSVAFRYKSQFNENSKSIAHSEILPELHHNEVESWKKLDKKFSVILLRDSKEAKDIYNSFAIDKRILEKKTNVYEIIGYGDTKLERMLYLIICGDFISYFLAEMNNVNPSKTILINKIKDYLAKHD